MSSPGRIYVSGHLGDSAMGMLAASPWSVDVHSDADRPPAPDELIAAAKGCVGAVTLLTERIDAAFFDMVGDRLRVVASVAVGTDNIDVEAASQHGVIVTNTPDVLTDSTAELTMALLLAASRRVAEGDRLLRGDWEWIWGPRLMLGRDLRGEVLGIVGYGRIGAAVARLAQAFGMGIIATGRQAGSAEAEALGVRSVSFEELLARSDAVSLHCPLTPQTHHLIGAAELGAMKSHAVLVNTGRGPLIDEAALVDALRRGQIRAAGLDVFEHEPNLHPGLRALPNVVLTPHIGSAGVQTRDRMAGLAVGNVLAVLSGRPALTPVLPVGRTAVPS